MRVNVNYYYYLNLWPFVQMIWRERKFFERVLLTAMFFGPGSRELYTLLTRPPTPQCTRFSSPAPQAARGIFVSLRSLGQSVSPSPIRHQPRLHAISRTRLLPRPLPIPPATLSLDFAPLEPGAERERTKSSKDSLSNIERRRRQLGSVSFGLFASGLLGGCFYLGREWTG